MFVLSRTDISLSSNNIQKSKFHTGSKIQSVRHAFSFTTNQILRYYCLHIKHHWDIHSFFFSFLFFSFHTQFTSLIFHGKHIVSHTALNNYEYQKFEFLYKIISLYLFHGMGTKYFIVQRLVRSNAVGPHNTVPHQTIAPNGLI